MIRKFLKAVLTAQQWEKLRKIKTAIYGFLVQLWTALCKILPDRLLLFLRSHTKLIKKMRSEEHTSELQSRGHLVCRLLLEKKTRCRKRLGWLLHRFCRDARQQIDQAFGGGGVRENRVAKHRVR